VSESGENRSLWAMILDPAALCIQKTECSRFHYPTSSDDDEVNDYKDEESDAYGDPEIQLPPFNNMNDNARVVFSSNSSSQVQSDAANTNRSNFYTTQNSFTPQDSFHNNEPHFHPNMQANSSRDFHTDSTPRLIPTLPSSTNSGQMHSHGSTQESPKAFVPFANDNVKSFSNTQEFEPRRQFEHAEASLFRHRNVDVHANIHQSESEDSSHSKARSSIPLVVVRPTAGDRRAVLESEEDFGFDEILRAENEGWESQWFSNPTRDSPAVQMIVPDVLPPP